MTLLVDSVHMMLLMLLLEVSTVLYLALIIGGKLKPNP
jgi:hypothetical protein